MKLNNNPVITGNSAKLTFGDFSLNSYLDFIQIRSLPTYKVTGYEVEFPANYVDGFYQAEVKIPLPVTPTLFDYQQVIAKVAFIKQRYGIFLDMGLGKCMGIDTPIIMLDGTVKMVQDIQAGEQLLGPDSKPRKVLSTTKGYGSLFKVTPIKGDSFVCNDAHILSLKASGTKKHCRDSRYVHGKITNISISNYLNETQYFREHMKLWRTGVDFSTVGIRCDAYVVGTWLGDGTVGSPQITTCNEDLEVIEYLGEWADRNDLTITNHGGNGCLTRSFITPYGQRNWFRTFVQTLYTGNEKRIPTNYLINSTEIRLELLAGLLDADGFFVDNCYEIVTVYSGLADDIAFLARSLGLGVTRRLVTKGIKSTGYSNKYHKLLIYGNTDKIPNKLPRKKSQPRKQAKSALVTGFKVEHLGEGDYYGFALDGDSLYLLGDFTVTHNTLVGGELIRQVHANNPTKKILYITALNILNQSQEMCHDFFTDFPESVNLHDSKLTLKEWAILADEPVAFINHEAFIKIDKLPHNIEMVFLDECFVGDTPIDTPQGTKRIADIKVGDYVYNATGKAKVKATHKRYKRHLVLTSIQGRDIISSVNHPYFTHRGWVKAKDLKEGDYVLYTSDVMRMVREATNSGTNQESGQKEQGKIQQQDFLLKELLCEMENVATRNQSEGSQFGSEAKGRESNINLAQQQRTKSNKGAKEIRSTQSDVQSSNQREGIQDIKGDGTQAANSRWEWQGITSTSEDATRSNGRGMDTGVLPELRQEAKELPHSLQDRYSESPENDSYRGGRIQPQCNEGKREGQKEGHEIEGARVDSVTIYESTNPIFDRYRDETGRVALYDLEVEGHPSFSVHGLLVHNCSILKGGIGGNGKIAKNLIAACKGIPKRYTASGTPSPNDKTEYAMCALFLGYVNSEKEFYSMYFVNKDGEYQLRRHATEKFYQYLASWSIFMRNPAAYGFNDNLKDLLPWQEMHQVVDMTPEQTKLIERYAKKGKQAYLPGIAIPPSDMGQRSKFSQISKGFAYNGDEPTTYVASNKPESIHQIVLSHKDTQVIIWTVFDQEGDILETKLKDEGYRVAHITGKTKPDTRLIQIEQFRHGELDVIISKPRILGFGLNFQFCYIEIFSGLQDSFESYIQAVKRVHRYGQTKQVLIYLVYTPYEEVIIQNVLKKQKSMEQDFKYQERLYINSLADELKDFLLLEDYTPMEDLQGIKYEPILTKDYQLYHGDSIKMMLEIRDGKEYGWLKPNSVDLSVFSPPFPGDVFTYSRDPADMGNTRGAGAVGGIDDFMLQFQFFLEGMRIVTKPGRLMAMHLEDIPFRKGLDGYIGIYDVVGEAIRQANKAGWILIAKIPIVKNQQMQAIMKKISSLTMSNMEHDRLRIAPANNGYMCLFKKPGEADIEVSDLAKCHACGWQGYAHDLLGWQAKRGYKSQFLLDTAGLCPKCESTDILTFTEMDGNKWIICAEGVWPDGTQFDDFDKMSKISRDRRWYENVFQTALGTWFDVQEPDILRLPYGNGAQDAEDSDKHLCPLPLTVIQRPIEMYTLPGELVFTPFSGSGTALDRAIRLNRKVVGIELKPEYWRLSYDNVERAISESQQLTLFDLEALRIV